MLGGQAGKLPFLTRGVGRRPMFVIGTLAIALAVLASIAINVKRSFLIDANTSFIAIEFQGPNAWKFSDVSICRPSSQPNRTAETLPDAACSAIDQETEQVSNLTLNWPDNARISVRAEAIATGYRIRLHLVEGVEELFPEGTEIVVPEREWETGGALVFGGTVVLGNILGSSEKHYLQSADWEARQTSLASNVLRMATETIMTGKAMRGAELEIVVQERRWWSLRRGKASATVYGHLSPTLSSSAPPSFNVGLVSEPGLTELSVRHYGLEGPTTIRPSFIDTAASSVVLFAAIAILSLLAALTQVIGDMLFSGVQSAPSKDNPRKRSVDTDAGGLQDDAQDV